MSADAHPALWLQYHLQNLLSEEEEIEACEHHSGLGHVVVLHGVKTKGLQMKHKISHFETIPNCSFYICIHCNCISSENTLRCRLFQNYGSQVSSFYDSQLSILLSYKYSQSLTSTNLNNLDLKFSLSVQAG